MSRLRRWQRREPTHYATWTAPDGRVLHLAPRSGPLSRRLDWAYAYSAHRFWRGEP